MSSAYVDRLRKAYAASGLAIRPKTQVSEIEAPKEIIRSFCMNPEQALTRDALSEGAITCKNAEDYENQQLAVLSSQLKQLIRQEATV